MDQNASPNASEQRGRGLTSKAPDELDDPGSEAHTTGPSIRDEDARTKPKNLQDTMEHVRERSEERVSENSAKRAGDEPDDQGGTENIPGDVQSVQKVPMNVGNECVDGTDAPEQYRAPGGHSGNQGELKVVEDDSSRENVVCSGKHNGICPRSEEDECVVEINALCRENGPGGHRGEWETSRAVERDWRRKFDESLMCQ